MNRRDFLKMIGLAPVVGVALENQQVCTDGLLPHAIDLRLVDRIKHPPFSRISNTVDCGSWMITNDGRVYRVYPLDPRWLVLPPPDGRIAYDPESGEPRGVIVAKACAGCVWVMTGSGPYAVGMMGSYYE